MKKMIPPAAAATLALEIFQNKRIIVFRGDNWTKNGLHRIYLYLFLTWFHIKMVSNLKSLNYFENIVERKKASMMVEMV